MAIEKGETDSRAVTAEDDTRFSIPNLSLQAYFPVPVHTTSMASPPFVVGGALPSLSAFSNRMTSAMVFALRINSAYLLRSSSVRSAAARKPVCFAVVVVVVVAEEAAASDRAERIARV